MVHVATLTLCLTLSLTLTLTLTLSLTLTLTRYKWNLSKFEKRFWYEGLTLTLMPNPSP